MMCCVIMGAEGQLLEQAFHLCVMGARSLTAVISFGYCKNLGRLHFILLEL